MKVKELKDQPVLAHPRPVLRCNHCGVLLSADRRNYWAADPEKVIKHCRRNMVLVIERHTFEPVVS